MQMGKKNNISVAVSKMQANIQFMIDKATYFFYDKDNTMACREQISTLIM